ncbi:hypothetical protein [Mesobacillus zeae]|uniref:Uncharacterized protein n=1 Tax=Mesobacillus zeae TaxID=1917180 RepID=A0A398BKD0_9BACI|nr:hypothetical protein [Mesobacillus zeae]RID88958.1 hypothetical protein D1970_00205 [Mesobacillus zeae]
MTVHGFMEDWDGEIVLSDIHNFKDENDFSEQAEKYVKETRGYRVPLFPPVVMDIVYNGENEECWSSKNYALKTGFEGEIITVYRSTLDYDNAEG